MKITKREFGKIARKEAYEELERALDIDNGPSDALEGVMLGLTVIFLNESKKNIFGEEDEVDIEDRDVLVHKMADASATVITSRMSATREDWSEGFMDLLLGLALSGVQGTIAANIVKHYFKEEE